jgi:hypothetical protein
MKVLRYFYCRFYQLMVSVGNGDIASFVSILLMTFLLFNNFIAIAGLFYAITGRKTNLIAKNNLLVILELAIMAGVLYFLLVWRGRSTEILKSFEAEPKSAKRKGRAVIVIYFILTLALFMSSNYLIILRNKGLH